MLNAYKFVRILAIRGALSWSVTESGGVEKSAQMSRLVAEDQKSDMKSSRSILWSETAVSYTHLNELAKNLLTALFDNIPNL